VHVHTAALLDDHITTIDGVPVTSLVRTVLDLCRTLPIEQAVAVGDRAWHTDWYVKSWRISFPGWRGGRAPGKHGVPWSC
jgi:hypothetical protein